jgi:hypothetical protein
VAGTIKIDKFSKDPFKSRDDVRRRLRALSCEKSSNIADPQEQQFLSLNFYLLEVFVLVFWNVCVLVLLVVVVL